MATAAIRYLHAVDGYLLYRRRVPADLKGHLRKSEWKHALGLRVGEEAKAAAIISDYNQAYSQLIAQERVRKVSANGLSLPAGGYVTPTSPAEPVREIAKLSEVYKYDLNTHGGLRDEKVFKVSVDSVLDLMGDIDLVAMTPKDVQIWIGKCENKNQKPTTIKRRINALHSMVNRYFRDHEIEKKNPFSNVGVKDGTGTKSDRLPFNRDHLKLIDRYFDLSPRLSDDIRRIVPLLKLTGARPLEIGGLDAGDILLDHDIAHIWIRNNAHRRIKTKGSERRIPLVGAALDVAKAAKLENPAGAVFSRTSHNTNTLSQRLNKFIRRSGVPKSSRLVAYIANCGEY